MKLHQGVKICLPLCHFLSHWLTLISSQQGNAHTHTHTNHSLCMNSIFIILFALHVKGQLRVSSGTVSNVTVLKSKTSNNNDNSIAPYLPTQRSVSRKHPKPINWRCIWSLWSDPLPSFSWLILLTTSFVFGDIFSSLF